MATFSNPFHPIDVEAAARWTYPGQVVSLHPAQTPNPAAEHAYSWAAKLLGKGDQCFPIDLHGYVKAVYGPDCRVVQSDMSRYGWKRVYPQAPQQDWAIQPVVFVAADQIGDVASIAQGIRNYRHNVGAMADWYQRETGKAMKLLEPHVFVSRYTAAEWLAIYKDQRNRFDTWEECQKEILAAYGNKTNPRVIYAVTQFCGLGCVDWDWDAAGGPIVAIPSQGDIACVSAFACCHAYADNTPTPYDETAVYALAHEVGHCLELDHTPDTDPNWTRSIMRSARPPGAILVASDRHSLLTRPSSAPFFT